MKKQQIPSLFLITVLCSLFLLGISSVIQAQDDIDWIDFDESMDAVTESPGRSDAQEAPRAVNNVEYIDFLEQDIPSAVELEPEVIEGTDRITITLDDVLLEDAVRMFARTTGANIIATSSLLAEKRVTVNLVDVDWRPALRSILEIHDLELAERSPGSGVFSIRARVADAPPPTMVQTFFLDYTTTGEVKETIESMLRPGASLTTFPSRNAIVVRAQEANLGEIADLIAELDRPGRQVLIETRILELTDEARKAVGIDWSVLAGYQVGFTDMSRVFVNDRSRRLESRERGMLYDYRGEHSATHRFFDETGAQIPGASVDFDTWRASPNFDGVYSDMRWDGTPTHYGTAEGGRGAAFESLSDRLSTRAYSDIMTAVLSPADFSIVLSALHATDGVSIVSNPKMLVTSGSTNAFFSVGFREPIIEVERQRGTQESPGDIITSRLATGINTEFIRQGYLEEGVDLRVIATVKTDDHIEADIRPSLRRAIDEKRVGDNSWPILSVKEINTTFTLRSGQTVAIGGLTEARENKVTTRVPILGSIPILGRLFRHERDVTTQTETIIFVTLSVADPDRLDDDAGIPEDARIVHTRRLQDQQRRMEFQQQLEQLRAAQEASESTAGQSQGRGGNDPQPEPIAPQRVPRQRLNPNSPVPRN